MNRLSHSRCRPLPGFLFLVPTLAIGVIVLASHHPEPGSSAHADWRSDPAWHAGRAEWALYDAVRPIYGVARHYDATVFTNTQHMDPASTTKAGGDAGPEAFEVFKHNVSEMIETENYTYRFLTTCFIRADTLEPYKVVASTQEDCGATYKQFVVEADTVRAEAFCYFPGAGAARAEYARPANLAFHDALTLSLRGYPFDDERKPTMTLELVPDQTDTHETPLRPENATVRYVGRETLVVPYGSVDTHHLRLEHAAHGGAERSDYWFAADAKLRHVLVKYQGPWGVQYELKKLGWWRYWDRTEPRPE